MLARTSGNDTIADRAHKIHFSSIVLDTHEDTPLRFVSKTYDLGKRNPDGHVDIPRMLEGGLNSIFFSVYMLDDHIMAPIAVQKALDQTDAIHDGT